MRLPKRIPADENGRCSVAQPEITEDGFSDDDQLTTGGSKSSGDSPSEITHTRESSESTHEDYSTVQRIQAAHSKHAAEGSQQLLVIVCIPLLNGIFPALLVAGQVHTLAQMIVIALTIFTGAGALTVLYSHADSRREARTMVTPTAMALLVGAVLAAATAPVFETIFVLPRLEVVTGFVILIYAAIFLDIPGATKIPTNALLLLGFGLSIQNPGAIAFSTIYLKPALMTALFAIGGLYLAASIHPSWISVSTMRKGGGIVLALIGVSVMGTKISSKLTLGVFAATLVAALATGIRTSSQEVDQPRHDSELIEE